MVTTWLAKPIPVTGQVNATSEIVKPRRGRPKGAKNKPKEERGRKKKSDIPSEQELQNIERRTQEVRMAREYGVDPKELEGKSPSEVKAYYRQVRAAMAKKAKAKAKKKRKNVLDGATVAKKLEAKLNKIRKKHGNPVELSINQFQPSMRGFMISGLGNAVKAARAGWKKLTASSGKETSMRKKAATVASTGMTGVGIASVIPPSRRERYEAKAKEAIEKHCY